jgi:EAL domain-containing protein (putative c-di-GMP-specific phosphodiesterase class I)
VRHNSTNSLPTNPFADVGASIAPPAKSSHSQIAMLQLVRTEDLSVVFQPIVRLDTMKIFAYEALARCAVPAFSNPMVLFERAVRDGCCGRLGRAVREAAIPLCEGVPVFINVHPLELEERWLVRADDPLYFHDRTVYLEITEAVPLTHFDLCRSVLKDVRRRADVRLVVDDLGAGYSNLKHIADLEPAVVKLDRNLIVDLDRSKRHQTLVAGIVRLCADLGAEVVAEGIETVDELKAVRDTGVHYVQGFLLARPGFPLPSLNAISF